MEKWQGRVALVTGASNGIGAAICDHFLRHGMKVVGCARSAERVADAQKSHPKKANLHAVKCDLTNESEIDAMFDEISKKYGQLDVLVNNAGLSTGDSMLSGDRKKWRQMLDLNVMSYCICQQKAIKMMMEKNIDDGVVINLNSVVGHKVLHNWGSTFYSATKAAITFMTRGTELELRDKGSGIKVTSVSPGAVKTNFMANITGDKDVAEKMYEQLAYLVPDDVAAACVYVLSQPQNVDIGEVLLRPVDPKKQGTAT